MPRAVVVHCVTLDQFLGYCTPLWLGFTSSDPGRSTRSHFHCMNGRTESPCFHIMLIMLLCLALHIMIWKLKAFGVSHFLSVAHFEK